MRRATSLPLALLLLACFGLAEQAREVREGLIGLSARGLRSCLGIPWFLDVAEEREIWAYRLPIGGGYEEIDILLADGPGTAHKRPSILRGKPS
ncbi:MAG: hypothetical protein ACE5JG_13290, partial [Planctomycetota bacterium]